MLIDLGANLLPGFVGGTTDVSSSVERIKDLGAFGVAAAVLTPRYYPSKMSTDDFLNRREVMLNKLSAELPVRRPVLYVGCEVYTDERLKYIHDIGKLAIKGTRTIIASMPEGIWENALIDTLLSIKNADYEVVITHLDSAPVQYAEGLFKLGFKGIADASAFSGLMNLKKRKQMISWIDDGKIIGLGSNYEFDDPQKNTKTERIRTVIGDDRTQKIAVSSAELLAGAYSFP